MINAFDSNPIYIQFPGPPLRGNADRSSPVQASGYDSAGAYYCYTRGNLQLIERTLVYSNISAALLADLRDYIQARSGNKSTFTWWDHLGVSHTVRFVSGLLHKQTGPGRYRVEMTVEEAVASTAIAGTATDWDTVFSSKTALTPIWILRTNFDGTVRDYSDSAWTFPGGSLNSFTTTLPLVAEWGQLRENVRGNIGEILIADINITLLVDQTDASNIRHLAQNHELETNPVELYLTAAELNPAVVAPRLMFRGYVNDIRLPDETQVQLTIEDESIRLETFVGVKISSEAYPLCDPDEVGRVIPEVYGTVQKLPGLCVDAGFVTTLAVSVTATDTSITLSEVPAYSILYKYIYLEDEIIYSTGQNGTVLTVIRGALSTVKVEHVKGKAVMERMSRPLVYLLANHPLTAINTVYARVRGINVDITSDVTKYLSVAAGDLGGRFVGKAAITIPDIVRVSQRITLALSGDVSVGAGLHGHAAGTISTTTPVSTTQNLSDGGQKTASVTVGSTIGTGQWIYYYKDVYYSFPGAPGTVLTSTFTLTISCPARTKIYLAGLYHMTSDNTAWVNKEVSFSWPDSLASYRSISAYAIRLNVEVGSIWIANGQMIQAPTTYTKYVTVTGSRAITYNSTTSANVSISDASTPITVNNTLALTGNSVADIYIGDLITADVAGKSSVPADVFDDLLTTWAGDTSFTQVGTLPTSYSLNGAITDYRPLREWLDLLAFQCCCWFRKTRGVSQLIVRSPEPGNPVSLSTCTLSSEGIKDIVYRKAPLSDVINKINLLYDRDWSDTGSGAEAYRRTVSSSDSVSITQYGEREVPGLFMFDFVTSGSMASSVAAFYQDFFAVRKWFISFSSYLDNCSLEFADNVELGFAADATGVIVEGGLQPGNSRQIDTIRFTIVTTRLPMEVSNALVTMLGENLVTKDREVIIYV